MTNEFSDVSIHREGVVAWLTIEREDSFNALRWQTFDELRTAAEQLDADREVRVVVLTGAGQRAFSSGITLDDEPPPTDEAWDELTRRNAEVIRTLWYLDTPLVTAVNGYALAAGCNLALVGDITMAGESAVFGEPEIRHGSLSPLLLLPWMTHFKAYNELYLTGDRCSAEQAKQLGLVNHVVADDELLDASQAIAERIANGPAYALKLAKRTVRLTLDAMGFHAAQEAHRYIDTYALAAQGDPDKERIFGALESGGIRAFLEERDGCYGER